MTTFREGDVVTVPALNDGRGEYREEYRVESADSVWVRISVFGNYYPRDLKLLRRPLRVGDRIKHRDGAVAHVTETVCTYAPSYAREGWTHEDGTPIDVEAPAVEAKAPAQALTVVASKEIKNGKLVAIRPDGSVAEHRSFGESVNEALMQRANRLSDECGALASANRELLAENATLRRDVERLTRKARR